MAPHVNLQGFFNSFRNSSYGRCPQVHDKACWVHDHPFLCFRVAQELQEIIAVRTLKRSMQYADKCQSCIGTGDLVLLYSSNTAFLIYHNGRIASNAVQSGFPFRRFLLAVPATENLRLSLLPTTPGRSNHMAAATVPRQIYDTTLYCTCLTSK